MSENKEEKPNIALIVWDTAKGSHFGCNGYSRNTTPYVDKLAEEGFNFTNAYATTCWTHPSHVSMFSGKQLHEHGITSMGQDVDGVEMELLESLDDLGYTLYGFSNNAHVSSKNSYDEYFDEFYSIDNEAGNIIIEKAKELHGPEISIPKKYVKAVYNALKEDWLKSITDLGFVLAKTVFYPDDGARRTVSKIEKELEEEPFFLFANFIEPHMLYRPPHIYSQIFQDRPRYFSIIKSQSRKLRRYISGQYTPDEKYKEIMTALYDGELRYLDAKMKELHRFLEYNFGETILIITSDHGEYLFEQDMTSHLSGIHREVLGVPLVIYGAEKGVEEESFSLKDLPDLILNLPEIDGSTGTIGAEFAGITSAAKDTEFLTDEEFDEFDKSMISVLDMEEQVIVKEGEEAEIPPKFTEIFQKLDFPEKTEKEVDEEIKSELEKLGYM